MGEDITSATPDGLRPAAARNDALDALRGLAVLGIFVINIIGFSLPEIAFSNPKAAGGDGALNYGLWSFTTVFVEGSMRGLFSLMFGAGVILFTARADEPGNQRPITALFHRRNAWLIAFGLIHGFLLLMPGDILLIYGIAGLFLFPLRRLPPRVLTGLAAVFLIGLTCLAGLEEWEETDLGNEAAAIEARKDAGETISPEDQEVLDAWAETYAYNWPDKDDLQDQIDDRTADPVTVFTSNAEIMALYSTAEDIAWWVADALMMMLLGMAFYKWRIITAERSTNFYAVMMVAGYAVGLSFRIWAVAGRWEADFSPILWAWGTFDQVGRLAMTLGHTGLFFLLWKMAASSLPMRALTAAGRMALTNYIGQTVIANLIFTGVGLGLYGALDRAGVYTIMMAIWLVQLAFSLWWLARYRFGPLEWGWRSLTYWRLQPLRK